MKKLILFFIIIPNLLFASSMKMIGEKGKVSEVSKTITIYMYDNYYKPNEIDIPILNNPVLNQYQKNKNIKELKSTTLLPLALIMGLNIFKKHI